MTDSELGAVRDALADVYRPEGVDIWLAARNRMLDGRRPIDCDAVDVLRVVERLASGSF